MKTEDCESVTSKKLSSTVSYLKNTNVTGLASLAMSIIWVVCGLAVIAGASPVNAIVLMLASYFITRVIGHFDDSSESQLKTGVYGDIKTHEPETEYSCVNCAEMKDSGTLSISYNVYYISNYEVARTERTRNLKCSTCEQDEEESVSMERELA